MASMPAFSEQLKRHSVALISLFIAVSSLGYNTWRNEQSEANRNVRTAGIELLIKLGELDRIVLHAQYGQDRSVDPENTDVFVRSGWADILTIRDLGSLTVEPAISSSKHLFEIWSANYRSLGGDDRSASKAISTGIDQAREDILVVMAALD